MDSLAALQAFVHAAEAGGFSEAGRKLGVSASAISKAIHRLEERIGARLFHRSTRSVTLTSDGALFLERCRRIIDEFDAAQVELARSDGPLRGRLRISVPSMGMVFAPGIADFRRKYPDVTLEIDFTDRVVDVIAEAFDAVIRAGTQSDSRLMSRVIGQYRRIIVGSPNYLAGAGIPMTPDDLATHACLRYRSPTTGKLDEWPFPPSDGMVMNTLEPQIYMAVAGAGLACVPDIAVAGHLQTGALVSVLDDDTTMRSRISVLWPSSRQMSPKVRAFVDSVASRLPETPHGIV